MNKLLFDKNDRKLLEELDSLSVSSEKKDILFNSHLHPRGIKELVNNRVSRVAKTLYHLLDRLEDGLVDERLWALHSLRDEVIFSSKTPLNKNTARVLISVMKDLIRETDPIKRLELSNDFHTIMTGKPLIVRKFLKKYHLLEMSEDWNQITFDHHVHDAHTKGRKSPSHLIMDAWIKGIRDLQVIYYDFIPYDAARELLTAGQYMDINIRIGIDFPTKFRNKTAHLIWTPRGFKGTNHFLEFLREDKVRKFIELGHDAAAYQKKEILEKFRVFNREKREILNRDYDLDLPSLNEQDLEDFVETGQLSLLHVSEFIFQKVFSAIELKIESMRSEYHSAGETEKERIHNYLNTVNQLSSELIFDLYLKDIPDNSDADPDKPELLKLTPESLISILEGFHSSYRITLNLTGLNLQDVIELLFSGGGRINNLEIFNYKDYAKGLTENIPGIKQFQHALNEGNTIKLKRIIFSLISELKKTDERENTERLNAMNSILNNLSLFLDMYKDKPLKDKIGSDSTGRSSQLFGMGFAVKETLPKRTQYEINKLAAENLIVMPVHLGTVMQKTFIPLCGISRRIKGLICRIEQRFPGILYRKIDISWKAEDYTSEQSDYNNIIALGSRKNQSGNMFSIDENPGKYRQTFLYKWKYLNSGFKNGAKIFLGFIPAFLTFFLTKDWWVLAYLGAPIWFGITGLRNILQSVFGGDSLKRSHLLNWKDYVSWSRVSDSLLYTGISVPLLDYFVKQLLLDRVLHINTTTNVVALYAFIALVNGVYTSTHNFFRGLPMAAIIGNFFRSILSIPIAVAINYSVGGILAISGIVRTDLILQKWASIISKTASDAVGGIIEGLVDRNSNIRVRFQDYKRKLDQMYKTYVMMDLLLPDTDVLDSLKEPKNIISTINIEEPDLLQLLIYDSLDFLYFWMYQPHARTVLKKIVKAMSHEERIIFLRFQYVLRRKKIIATMFVDDLVGKDFSKPLAFFLDKSDSYLKAVDSLIMKVSRQRKY